MYARIRLAFCSFLLAVSVGALAQQSPAPTAAPTPVPTPGHLQLNNLVDCLERSQGMTEQAYPAFHAQCETVPFYEVDALEVCANSAGFYCQGLVKRLAEPDGSLAFIVTGSGKAMFLRKDMHAHLNRDPMAELLIIDAEHEMTYKQLALVIGCQLGRGTVQLLKDRPRADSPFDVIFHARWSQEGKEELDEVARFVCRRDAEAPAAAR